MSSRGKVIWKDTSLEKPDISAPGIRVYSAGLENSYKTKSGTSMSTPYIAGALALMLQKKSEHERDDFIKQNLITILFKASKDLGLPGIDSDYGYGRADLFEALDYLTGKNLMEL